MELRIGILNFILYDSFFVFSATLQKILYSNNNFFENDTGKWDKLIDLYKKRIYNIKYKIF